MGNNKEVGLVVKGCSEENNSLRDLNFLAPSTLNEGRHHNLEVRRLTL